MIENIILIVPPNVPFDEIKYNKENFSLKLKKEIPLGVLSIATYLKNYCNYLNIKIIDFNVIFYDLIIDNEIYNKDLLEIFNEYLGNIEMNVELIGISSIFNTTFSYLEPISMICNKLFPEALIISGGGLPNSMYKEVLERVTKIDAICLGEGEIPILELVKSNDINKYLTESLCWVTRDKINTKVQYIPKFIEDLDEIPSLDYSLIEIKKYNQHIHNQSEKVVMAIPLMFSRGCPFNCCFCASHSIHGKKVRYNSLKRIILDITDAVNYYGVNAITVWDDNFFVDKEQAIKLLDFFKDMNLKVEFVNGFPVYRMDDEMALNLKGAGVDVVTLAIESGNQRVLSDIIHKPLKLDMVKKAVDCLRKYDMYVKGLFVIGFPGETIQDIYETVKFIRTIELNWVDVYIASPVAGSELYEICKENNYLVSDKIEDINFWKSNIKTLDFSPEQIQEIQLSTVLEKDFVNNYDVINGNYIRALKNFEYCILGNPDNPFAYYFASICCKKLDLEDDYMDYKNKFKEIIKINPKWIKYFCEFSLDIDS